MVALTSLNLPIEAWKSARLLGAVPNCRVVLMLAYHMLSPALSVEEAGLVTYLQSPPDAGPSLAQVTTGLQNWRRAGRRLVEIGGRLPTATQLHQSSVKILSKHLATNNKVSFVFQQKSSTMPMMNPNPSEVADCQQRQIQTKECCTTTPCTKDDECKDTPSLATTRRCSNA